MLNAPKRLSKARLTGLILLSCAMLLSIFVSSSLAVKIKNVPILQTSFIGNSNPAMQGTPNALIGILDLYNQTNTAITLTGITVRIQGSAQATLDISETRLWQDDGDLVFDPLKREGDMQQDTTVSVIRASESEPSVLRLSNAIIKIPSRSHKYYYVAADLSWTADIDKVCQPYILNGDIAVAAPAKVNDIPETGLFGTTMTVIDRPDNYKIVSTANTPDSIARNSENNVVQILTLLLDGNVTTLRSIMVNRTGNTTDTATKPGGIRLWNDIDNSGTVTPPDSQLSTSANFVNSVAIFDTINLDVYAIQPARILVTYSISANAPLNTFIGSQITDSSSIIINPEDVVKLTRTPLGASFADPFGGNTLMVSSLSINDAEVRPGEVYKVVHGLSLSALEGNDINVKSIRYSMVGSASASDILSFKLVDDVNRNGLFDSEDSIIDMRSLEAGSINFELPDDWMVTANSTRYVLAVVDIAGNAKPETTIQLTLDENSAVEIDSKNNKIQSPDLVGPILSVVEGESQLQSVPKDVEAVATETFADETTSTPENSTDSATSLEQ